MACSKVIENVTVDMGPLSYQIIDGIIRHHQVGGLYITQHEFDILRAIWEGRLEWMQLPCRLQELAARFTRMGRLQCQGETTYNLCRLSMGLTSDQMRLLDLCFEEEKKTEGKAKIELFVSWLMQKCTIKEERYILDHCFIVPYCNEHDMCKLFFGLSWSQDGARRPARFCCCSEEKCQEFCNFHKAKEVLRPLAKVMQSTAFLKVNCTPCTAKKCKFC